MPSSSTTIHRSSPLCFRSVHKTVFVTVSSTVFFTNPLQWHQAKENEYTLDDYGEPIQLSDQADDNLIREYSLFFKQKNNRMLIASLWLCQSSGLCRKRSLLATWEMEQFLFNFENKEDLNSFLSQGPFHHNFCMFVLVCWEPVINDNARGRLTFKQDGGSQVSEEKSKPFRERASSYSRVQRSTYSLCAKCDSKHNDTQYKPYAYTRAKASVAYQDPRTEPVLMTAKAQSAAESSNTMDAKLKSTTKQTYIKDDDFTFRPSSERAHASHALHVDEQGNGDHSADEDMQDVVHGQKLDAQGNVIHDADATRAAQPVEEINYAYNSLNTRIETLGTQVRKLEMQVAQTGVGTEIRTVDFSKLNMEEGQDNPTFPEGPDSLRNHTKSKKKNR
uniref:Uncharacterized protein n=1 Tax=Brassica campestris TaxID=3711 RepID=M4FCU6_BRACM